jgi:hypothetical protein
VESFLFLRKLSLSEKDVLALKVVVLRKEISSRAKWRQTIKQ